MFKSETCKRIVLSNIAVSLVLFGVGMFVIIFYESFFQIKLSNFILGMVFGTAFSVLKIMLLERTVNKAVDLPKENAVNYTRMHYTLRYFLTGAVVVVAALSPWISLFGVVLAMVALRPAVYIASWLEKKHNVVE